MHFLTDERGGEESYNRMPLDACASLVRDRVSPRMASDMPFVGLGHIGKGTLSLVGIGTSNDVKSTKSCFRPHDVLFGKLNPRFRKVVYARFRGICSTDIWVVRANDGIVPRYLFYLLASHDFVDFATRGSQGTGLPRAKWKHVRDFVLPIPSLSHQRWVADTLGALDDKIDLNRRMNTTLEAMAHALFKSWFVDFDPVRAKAAGRDTGLPRYVADLFPDRFV